MKGRLTTEHNLSMDGVPIFLDDDQNVINWNDIQEISTIPEIAQMGGKTKSDAGKIASRNNGKLGGRPRKIKEE